MKASFLVDNWSSMVQIHECFLLHPAAVETQHLQLQFTEALIQGTLENMQARRYELDEEIDAYGLCLMAQIVLNSDSALHV